MPALILVVNTDPEALRGITALLSREAYLVIPASSFHEARDLLGSIYPDLLIADVRLEAFNGLHLAVQSRIDHPSLPVIITHTSADPVLEADARREGAVFIVKPLETPEFPHLVRSMLDEREQLRSRV